MDIKTRQMKIRNDSKIIRTIKGILSMYWLQKDNIKPRKLTPCIMSLKKLYILFISNKPNNTNQQNNTAPNRNDYSKNIQIFKHTTYDKNILSNCQEKKSVLFISNKSNNSTNHNNNASNCRANGNNIKTHNNITYDKSILSNCQEMKSVLFIYNTSNNSTNYSHSASNRRANGNKIQVLKHITYDRSILSNCQEMRNKLHNVVYSGCI